ncbi:MAG TPA: LysR family transcriptional regulator [Gemmatimonadaceae bacterium]|nr:LysR family transcriptional regulator [Gemmatimonadaceae bacterium]
MLLKNLEYLSALARERHFARAAAACRVTQPTLSAGIKQLEEEMGVLIVERGQRYRGLTPEGHRILAWAQRILADVEHLSQEVSEMRSGLVGRVRIGVIPVMLPIVSLLTSPFAERHPRVSITILSLSSIEIQRGLDGFALDAGLTYLDNEPLSHVRTFPLYRERCLLLTPADGPFGDREAVTWREASTLPLCLLTPDMQNRRIIDSHFREAGAEPRPSVETNSIVTLCSHLRAGTWSSVMPHAILYLVGEMPGVRAIPLVDPTDSHALGLIVPDRDPLPPITRALVEIAQQTDVSGALERELAPALSAPSGDGAGQRSRRRSAY